MSLPSNYVRVDYIQTSGTQWIDTGIKGNEAYAFDFSFCPTETQSSWHSYLGATLDNFTIGCYAGNTSTIYIRNRSNEVLANKGTILTNVSNTIVAGIVDKKIYINRVDTTNLIVSGSLDTTTTHIFIANNGGLDRPTKIRIYYLKLYGSQTELICDLVPVKNKDTNVLGMYDLVNDVFITNGGTGTFTYGHEIPENIILEDNPLQFVLSDDVSLQANFKIRYTIILNYDSSLGSASYSWGEGSNVNLSATPNANAQFKGWYIGDTLISRNQNTTYEVSGDTTFEARFTPKYNISLSYDSSVGTASFTRDTSEQNLIFLSVDSTITQFNGWYINNTLISYSEEAQYQITQDSVIEARFEPQWDINNSVSGDGSIQYTRQSSNVNIVSFSVIPDANRHFTKYVANGVEYTTTPLTLTLTEELTIVAYFEEDEKYRITASTNIDNLSIYVSNDYDYSGYTSTLMARPYPHYNFKMWSDGNTDNPRTIVVEDNITIIAEYEHEIITNGIYQYRCYVKDQMRLTDPPKAFMVVNTFDVKEDLLTTAKSTIDVYELEGNINNGDILVLYDPMGRTIYQGVVNSIQDTKITCSQMQSFYKGTWIYNIHSSSTLEQEIAWLLGQYAQGKIYGSTYTDNLVAQRLGGITIRYTGSLNVNLPTDLDKDGNEQYTQKDFEKFIYELYQDYGIIFKFEINFSGANYVDIIVPTYSSIKVGNNNYAINNLSPITTIEETNRLIIYWQSEVEGSHSAKEYRTTYVATSTGIVEQPTSLLNRFNITNTKIVFSDDDLTDIVAKNLSSVMFNHKITFDLLLDNSLYDLEEFKLSMPLDIWYGEDYYNSVLTGWQMKKSSNANPSFASFTCGKVRSALTKKLTLGVINA